MAELHKLPVKDKLKIGHDLWDDIAIEQSVNKMPTEHKRILQVK